MEEPPGGSRARSLGRSRSRGRPPNELFARKQQLLSQSSAVDVSWTASDTQLEPDQGQPTLPESRQRPQVRRSRLFGDESNNNNNEFSSGVGTPSLAEAKLESLSELLKAHQNAERQAQLIEQQQMSSPSSSKSIDDVYILLAKKEKDLQLAAELGKALLEKNDELSKANELITEDYSRKLELLEQDKHKLRRKLDQLDGEYENRLIELQTDCNILKNQLDEQQQLARQTEKEKSKLIDDLVQQNQRLTSELVEATKSEELLSSQLEQMNERFSVRLSSRQDQVTQLDTLKEEIQIVNQRKHDLERRLKLAQQDKVNLSGALEESGDKLMLLENLLNEKDSKLSELVSEVMELRDSSSWLANELESMISLNEKLTSQLNDDDNDYDEGHDNDSRLHLRQLGLASQRKRSQLVEQLKELRLRTQGRLKANEFLTSNNRRHLSGSLRRLRRRQSTAAAAAASLATSGDSASLSDELDCDTTKQVNKPANSDSASESDYQPDELIREIYALLRRFQAALQLRKDHFQQHQTSQQLVYSPNSPDDSGISADDVDKPDSSQTRDLAAWKRLLASLRSLIEEMPCSTCQLMIGERADYEQLQKTHTRLYEQIKRKDDELLSLSVSKTEQTTKLAALEERCSILEKDLGNCDKPKEEIVQLAWKARDEAVERKNGAEIALAKARIENMQIAGQLMEVVQQKGELSQKLAQFEDDIHYITQHSVKAKFTWEEYAEKLRNSKGTTNSVSNKRRAQSANPLAQLLSFSSAVSSLSQSQSQSQQTPITATTVATNGLPEQQQVDSNSPQPASLMRNFTSNRFNLKFWQRNSNEKVTPTVAALTTNSILANNNNTTNNTNNSSSNDDKGATSINTATS